MAGRALPLPAGAGAGAVIVAAAVTVFALAKGFGANSGAGKGWKAAAKERRAKLIPCRACKGSGKKPCQFCQGTAKMAGFLGSRGDRVQCIPCQGAGTLGTECPDCAGLGLQQ